ncbi:MAG: hypothetical protein AAGF84_02185 [Planctomycetota bacterium]
MTLSGFARLGITTAIAALTAVGGSVAQTLPEVGFDRDDFLVSSTGGGFRSALGGVFVLDFDLSLKGRLANSPDALSTGLDFDALGRLVARVNPANPRGALATVLEPSGRPAPEFPRYIVNSNGTLDLKVSNADTYLAASQDEFFGDPNGLLEFDRQGNLLRTLDSGLDYEGVAVLGDGTIWAGGGSFTGFLHAFDPVTGAKTELFQSVIDGQVPPANPPAFDGGQIGANSLTYDATTDTVLIADRLTNQVFERATDGTLLNTFTLPVAGTPFSLLGATRGPNGDVYAAYESTVYRFDDDGTFLDEAPLGGISAMWNIVWAGNAPLFNALPGDFDGDGLVAQGDLNLVLSNWGTDPTQADTIDDFVITAMLDGLVDQGELNAVLNHWGGATPPDLSGATVPEPASVFALLVFLLAGGQRAIVATQTGGS